MTALEQVPTTRVVMPAEVVLRPAPPQPAVFRFPAPDDPPPGAGRMLAIAIYSAGLGLCGVAVGLYAVVAVFSGAPVWYLPALAALTLLSVALVVAAFLAIHQRALPWVLLLAAAVPMAANVYLTML
ncbi:hypothetical protein [Actinoplanes philippinensis]|uniref:hypothetical protein n=1 Tax=Actinoplanes philippinensis TaxID=35752 RepID=UPI003403185E